MNQKKSTPVRAKATPGASTSQPASSRATYILGGLAVIVIAAVVVGGVFWQSDRSAPRGDGYGSVRNSAVEVSLSDQGVATLGLPTAPKTVEVFEDAMCPFCAELENTHGQELAQKIDAGEVKVNYHILDFLNRLSASGDYSTRAVAAAQCIASGDTGPVYSKFHAQLFSPTFQPKENGSTDHSNADLAALAKDSGASDTTVACINSGSRMTAAAEDARSASAALSAAGAKGTPTVVVDGTVVDTAANPNWVADL